MVRYSGVGELLALLGLFGMMIAGVAADLALNSRDDSSDESDFPEDDEEAGNDYGDLLDPPKDSEGIALSDDLPDPVDAPLDLRGGASDDLLSGGSSDDTIDGGAGADQIDGRAGDDLIYAGAGNDEVWAGEGNDWISGQDGNDTLRGQGGEDSIHGGAGNDLLAGEVGHDLLTGDAGSDTLMGGIGNDSLDGGSEDDWLVGGEGDDQLAGGAGRDILDGGTGNDWLSGLHGEIDDGTTDYLNGGDGNDILVLGAGDMADGGAGEDQFILHEWMSEASIARIGDYDPTQDQLVIVYDPIAHPDPVVTVAPSADGASQSIYLDGGLVAMVRGGLVDQADIRLSAA